MLESCVWMVGKENTRLRPLVMILWELAKSRVEGNLRGVELHVLDGVVLAPADVAGPVRGVAEGYLKDEVEFGREHFAAIQDSNEMRAHENGAGARGRDLLGVAPAVRQKALDVPVQPPLLRLQEAVQVRATVVVANVLDASAIGEDFYAVNKAAWVGTGELQRGVPELLRTVKPSLTLSPSTND